MKETDSIRGLREVSPWLLQYDEARTMGRSPVDLRRKDKRLNWEKESSKYPDSEKSRDSREKSVNEWELDNKKVGNVCDCVGQSSLIFSLLDMCTTSNYFSLQLVAFIIFPATRSFYLRRLSKVFLTKNYTHARMNEWVDSSRPFFPSQTFELSPPSTSLLPLFCVNAH